MSGMNPLSRFSPLAYRASVAALDFLLPPHCPGCAVTQPVPNQLCAECFLACHFIAPPFCRVCGVPFPSDQRVGPAGLCPTCIAQPRPFAAARGALAYDGMARTLILRFKNASETGLAEFLAPLMQRAGADLLAKATLVVAVPLHQSRLRARGYNQAVLLARALARRAGLPLLPDALVRTHATEKLRAATARSRAETLSDAIAVRPARAPRLVGQNVVVIDDVLTSGATLSACAVALRSAGATEVYGLAAARVPDPQLRPAQASHLVNLGGAETPAGKH